MPRLHLQIALLAVSMFLFVECSRNQNECPRTGRGCETVCDRLGLVSLVDVTGHLDAPPPSKTPIPVTLTATVAWSSSTPPPAQEVTQWFRELVKGTDAIFSPCNLALEVKRAEAVTVPARLMSVLANTETSWGGLAPEGEDPIRFNQAQNERLPEDVKTLFRFARRNEAQGVISVVVIDEIRYFAAQKPAKAGGFSFPPCLYRHPDDIPLRNGILAASAYRKCGNLPAPLTDGLIAHELMHMLLDRPVHETQAGNLLSLPFGKKIRSDQCARMRSNLKTLF